jgi:putative spermidine/putrescine transport system permease protein
MLWEVYCEKFSLKRNYIPAEVPFRRGFKDIAVNRLKRLLSFAPVLPLFLLCFMFLFIPLGTMLARSFLEVKGGGFTIQHYIDILTKAIYHAAIRNSLYLSFVSSIAGLIFSFFIALSLSQVRPGKRDRFMALLNMVSNFTGLPLGVAFMILLGTTGVLVQVLRVGGINLSDVFNLYSGNGLLLLYLYFQLPLGTLLLYPAFQGIRDEWKESAVLMGAYELQFWSRIGVPILLPSLTDTFVMLFANALTAYATPFVIMTTNYPLLPIKITSMYTGEAVQQQELGAALSIVMITIMLAVIAGCNLVKKVFYRGEE